MRGDNQQGVCTVGCELQITLAVEDGAELEGAFKTNAGVSITMPTGKIPDMSPPMQHTPSFYDPHTGKPEHSQRVEINGLLDVG